ncbi:anthranilate synthase component 2/putative glutamine amidotransferase [Saccharopolyspora erythraea NRRL 2338]|uniref:Anthranilate synthase component II n=2 Tax=Saccharopolyspora erythraea TaxID=1836 RepID=A4FKL7_SACEN|nr:gamma-glutamyl-gamma-aminobutyrate hydrolase family protein [Saccharopolyspora erythraea]EQD83087.1 anthranilate synthase [Saccharopolyspora erythraea D]PFG98230.1 anthranilate synthase component 2/putative glutamine amidotransferase [Saccharopolyspora erythraea NRRL 2338]QRK88327.1 gamma-glutamyl-gamma-aminobutyrate hydrolase family protein [Saccharopolyspora erythraea]CAM04592.1 anthranilate synthase component II [Saccharopolyspora erythraea NRRL 2338]
MVSSGSDRPRIGISTYVETASWGVWQRDAALLPTSYVHAVHRAGGIPVLLPVLPDGESAALSAVDGLVLAGGADVDPARYRRAPHETVRVTRPERDDWETRLLRAALDRDLPVLGVCRGAQVLNVALGGSLHQHLPERVAHERHQPAPAVFGRTRVRLRPGSRIARALGEEAEVPCYHHQALDRVADRLEVTGHAEDGTVEAVELPGHRFVVGVQWHPEEDTDDIRLFEALSASAGDSGGMR